MAINRLIDPDSGLIVLTASGTIKTRDIIEALKELMIDPSYKTGADILWDFRSITTPSTNSEEIRDLVHFIRKNRDSRGSDYKVALVVSRDSDYGIARMYEAYSEDLPFQIKIFREIEAAHSWLLPAE